MEVTERKKHRFTDELWLMTKREVTTPLTDLGFPTIPDSGVAQPEPPKKRYEYVVQTVSGKDVAVIPIDGDEKEAEANAKLISMAPMLLKQIEDNISYYCQVVRGYTKAHYDRDGGMFTASESCPNYHLRSNSCDLPVGEKCQGKKMMELVKMALNVEAQMTEQQVKVCREYLDVIEEILSLQEQNGGNYKVDSVLEMKRKKAHLALIETYGFYQESDTWDVTGNITKGMKPYDLHERLVRLHDELKPWQRK